MARNWKVTTDHEEIKRWIERRAGRPAAVRGLPSIIRVEFPELGNKRHLVPISWAEFFRQFESARFAFICEQTTRDGRLSYFCKLICREQSPVAA